MRVYHPLQGFYRARLKELTRLVYRIRYRSTKGEANGLTCNVCGRSYQKFVPHWPSVQNAGAISRNAVIAGYGKNVYCPGCLSTNRERLIIAVLGELRIKSKDVLHFAPEVNVFNYMKAVASVTTADIEPGFYRLMDPNILQADATKLGMPDGSFDIVVANHIMEHIPEDLEAMREFYRVLRAPGLAILQTPWSKALPATIEEPAIHDGARQMQLFGQQDHVRIYSFDDYRHRLAATGFIVEILTAESLARFQQYGIQPGEDVLLCRKLN